MKTKSKPSCFWKHRTPFWKSSEPIPQNYRNKMMHLNPLVSGNIETLSGNPQNQFLKITGTNLMHLKPLVSGNIENLSGNPQNQFLKITGTNLMHDIKVQCLNICLIIYSKYKPYVIPGVFKTRIILTYVFEPLGINMGADTFFFS